MINLKDAVSMRLWNVNSWYAGTFATEVLSNPEGVYTEDQLAQILVNIKDFADDDSTISTIQYGSGSERRYGFEDPVIYITEVLLAIQDITQWASGEGPGLDPPTLYNPSLAIEFFRPFPNEGVIHSEEWRVRIASAEFDLVPGAFQERGGRYYVMLFESSNPDYQFLRDFVEYSDAPIDGAVNVDPRVVLSWPVGGDEAQYDVYFGTNKDNVTDATFTDQQGVYADRIDSSDLPPREYDPPGELPSGTSHYWRVDYLDSSGEVLQSGQVMEFTTWTSEPEDYKGDISTIGDADVLRNIDEIVLKRRVPGAPGDGYVVVDRVDKNFTSASFEFEGVPGSAGVPETLQSYQRYNTYSSTVSDPANTGTSVNHLEIKRIWVQNPKVSTLGYRNERGIPDPGSNINSLVQARPLPFRNVGEIGNVFVKSAYPADDVPEIIDGIPQIIDRDDTEVECRVMLTDPDVQKLFNYFTMIAPADVNENRIKGRININTAPWYVLAQLPWVSDLGFGGRYSKEYDIAKSIIAYRDKLEDPVDYSSRSGELGFENIGQLNNVRSGSAEERIDYYVDGLDQRSFPDLTVDGRSQNDGAEDDLEESNLIFYRMSDLVTVRSDVFTAYILVRVGLNGPQRRYIAILDRSGVEKTSDRVKVIALHSVPDPR
jgi:hypothetical protein